MFVNLEQITYDMTTHIRTVLFGALVTALSHFAFGQSEETGKRAMNAMKWNVTDVIVGRVGVGFERTFGVNFSLGAEVDVISKDVFLESTHPWYPSQSTRKRGLILEPSARWYPTSKKSGDGGYLAAAGFFGFATYKLEDPGNGLGEPGWSAQGGSLQLGYQKLLGNMLVDGYIGSTWANDDYPGIYSESTAIFPPPYEWRVCAGLRLGLYSEK